MKLQDVMCDMETLATPDRIPVGKVPVIASLGAIRFNPYTGQQGDTFYRNVTRESCEALGMMTDDDTLDWWSRQSQAARDALLIDQIDIIQMCEEFRAWVRAMPKGQYLWGNGLLFDNRILRDAFRLAEVRYPFHWTHETDVRTLVRFGPKGVRKNEPNVGTYHNALDDSIYQANYCTKIVMRMKG